MESIAVDTIKAWRASPARMVRELFRAEPDPPQEKALELFPHSPRIALQSCTGAGKTTTLAWIGWNFLLTREQAMAGATSVSGDNLKTALWPELARWRSAGGKHGGVTLLEHLFEQTKTEIFHREHRHTWRLEARTWAKDADANQIGSALRGLHSKYVLWLLDETGGYPDAVLPVCEAIFSGDPIEAHIVQAGNPQKRSGPLWHAASRGRALWKVITITADPDDPQRTSRVSVEHARQQIEQWGRDNPWVIVNVLGQFPPSDINALIGPDEVAAAMKRYYNEFRIGDASKVLGIDVARFGDDASVIFSRHGLQAFPPIVHRNIDGTQGAAIASRIAKDFGADAMFIDDSGVSASWIDQLINLGRSPILVGFGSSAHDKGRYHNKRTEMYFDAVQWIRRGGALPECPELLTDLTQTTYCFAKNSDKILLEDKDQIKKRLGRSPDFGDAFVLTHAEPILPKVRTHLAPQIRAEDYNPFSEPARRREPARMYDAFR